MDYIAEQLRPLAVPIADLHEDPANARKGHAIDRIAASLKAYGQRKPIVVNRAQGGKVEAGNGTLAAAKSLGWSHIAAVFVDDDERMARAYALADNRLAELSHFDVDVLIDQLPGLGDLFTGFDVAELFPNEPELLPEDEPEPLTRADVPDAVFPTDNEWGIPVLSLDYQARFVDTPIHRWGTISRKAKHGGTVHFYTDDYRFEALWSDPSGMVNASPVNCVEPNYSTGPMMPRAVVLWATFRKRWIARYWQSYGINILVDLATDRAFRDLSLIGVPRGWRSYASYMRKGASEADDVLGDYEQACEHAGTKDLLFLLYGGENTGQKLARQHGWIWCPSLQKERIRSGDE